MKQAITSPVKNQPLKQKYLDVYMPKPCEFLRTPEQHQLSVLNLVQNSGAPYVWLPDNYFSQVVKPESKIVKYWKVVISTLFGSPNNALKKYTGWKQQKNDLKALKEARL